MEAEPSGDDRNETGASPDADADEQGLAEEKPGSGRTVAELRYKPDFVRVIIPQFDAKSTPSYLVKQYLGRYCFEGVLDALTSSQHTIHPLNTTFVYIRSDTLSTHPLLPSLLIHLILVKSDRCNKSPLYSLYTLHSG